MTTRERLRAILTISFPMVISQTSETVMMFVDRLFLSRLGKLYLASAMSGGLTSFVFTSIFGGIVGYVNALVAQNYGAGRKDQCARAVTQALYLSLASYPVLLLLLPAARMLFVITGHGPEQIALESAYLQVLMFGSVMFLLRNAITGFFTGTGNTRVVMVANITAMLVNIPSNYVLIFGKLGFPAMGIRGAAYGTLCGSFFALAILGIAYLRTIRLPEFRGKDQWRFSGPLFGRLLRFGAPAGIEMFLNVMAFNLFVQFMHSYGPDVAAAVTITFNWDLVAFVPMLGLGIATTAIVGQHIGAKDFDGARATTFLSLRLGYIYSGSLMLLFVFAARPLVGVFASGFPDPDGDVTRLAVTLLRLASIYTMADSTQLVFAGALRGAGDTAWIMKFSVVVHWIMAAIAILLIRLVHASPVLVWCVFITFVVILGVSMWLRFKSGKWRSLSLIS